MSDGVLRIEASDEAALRIIVRQQRAEIDRLRSTTLTDAERLAVREAADAYEDNDDDADCERIARTLRGLLERTK